MTIKDNQEFAIFTKVNELAERRGFKSYDFVATLQREGGEYVLDFESPASGNVQKEERYGRMLSDIGIAAGDSAVLKGDPQRIIDALDQALNISPRARFV